MLRRKASYLGLLSLLLRLLWTATGAFAASEQFEGQDLCSRRNSNP